MRLLQGYRERKAGKALGRILQEDGWAAAKKYVTELPGTLRAGAWAHGAVVVANGGKPLLARNALRQSVHLDGTRSDALLLLADLENEAGEAEAAIEHYRRLLALHPRAAGPALKLARLLLAAERFGEVSGVLDPFTSLALTDVAHLAHFHAPDDVQRRIEALYRQLGEEAYLLTTYATKNSAEFFAVAYVDYLDRRWDLPTTRESDADGLLGEVFAFFDELGRSRR